MLVICYSSFVLCCWLLDNCGLLGFNGLNISIPVTGFIDRKPFVFVQYQGINQVSIPVTGFIDRKLLGIVTNFTNVVMFQSRLQDSLIGNASNDHEIS